MRAISTGYRNLFGSNSDEEEKEDKGNEEVEEDNSFGSRWGWAYSVDEVSQVMRKSWDEVYSMGVLEFLNVLSYTRDKREFEKQALENWKKTH